LTFSSITEHSSEEMSKTGVYCIKHLPSNRIYIGSTSDSFKSRLKSHLEKLNKNQHHCRFLKNCWNKYGQSDFKFYILCFVDWTVEYGTADVLYVEQFYLDTFKPEFNSATEAASPKGYTHTEETKLKLSQIAVLKRSSKFTLFHETMGLVEGLNRQAFCEEHDLDSSSIFRILKGIGTSVSYKGFYRDEESYLKKLEKDKMKTSVHLGVSFCARMQKFKVTVKHKHYGYFESERDAAEVALIVRQIG
jgi:group I intron endonuclease